ncbi:hypothetical protein PMKS-000596 [Pichia membranifaciens]|uniref:Proteasome component ECM29 n=1 Tax=Pichia membranifaciens TaxID=4926 RepID=A0A1Q2YC76_9ASCO|nr:hypothetical protein PMKS-000596 [Pichia membranifaciens]
MSSGSQELQLIQKVELRFALADTNEKFQSALQLYLAPLLLKFASSDKQVKLQLGKTVKFLLSKFNATPELKLPHKALLDQVKSPNLKPGQESAVVQSYTLLFLSKSIPRLSNEEKKELFPLLIEDISTFKDSVSARLFNISCKILDSLSDSDLSLLANCLPNWKSEHDKSFLAEKYYKFMLLHSISLDANGMIPDNITEPGLSRQDCSFFFYYAGVVFNSSTLVEYKLKILKFIEAIQNFDKITIFLCASADGDSKISSFASTSLKRIPIDYENKTFIEQLVRLFVGDEHDQRQPARLLLQEKILNIFCKSKIATTMDSIEKISTIGLNSSNIKLKQSTVAFVRWFTTNNSLNATEDNTVTKIAHQLKLNLSDISADTSSPSYLDNRRYQYETLGLLLKKSSKLIDIPYIQFLIDMYSADDKELQPVIQDALVGLTTNLSFLSEDQRLKLKDLLMEIFEKSNETSNSNLSQIRFIGVKYINYLFPFSDAQARVINILTQSKFDRIETIEESRKGLNPYLFKLNNPLIRTIEFPQFDTVMKYTLKYKDSINLEVALTFAVRCLTMNLILGQDTIVAIDQYWETRIDKSLELDPNIKSSLLKTLKEFHDVDGDTTEHFANSSLSIFIDLAFDYIKSSNSISILILLTKILTMCSTDVTNSLTDHIPFLLDSQFEALSNESFHYVSELTGIICTTPRVENKTVLKLLDQLLKSGSTSSVGFIISRLVLRNRANIIEHKLFDSVLELVQKNLNTSSTIQLKMALDCISQLSMFGCLGPQLQLSSSVESFKIKFAEKLKPLVLKCNELAIYAWCYLSLSCNSNDENMVAGELNSFEKTLYETHVTKQTDNHFTTGEGFAILCDGWSSSFMKDKNDIPDCKVSIGLNPKRCNVILDNILKFCKTTKPSLRKASCIWLLSIIQYCTDDIIMDKINDIQFAFMRFLSDREEIIQESASRGLSITYEKGGYDVQETLIHNLLKSFTDSNKTSKELISGYVDENTELFDSGVLNTGDGESVSTYKDVLNLASEVGNPSLVYKFMSLAKNSALWSSRKGLAFGLGAILDKEKLDNLLKENPKLSDRLIPKLFRYKYDPSPSISRTMNNIWDSLIMNNKTTLSQNFESIMRELLTGMGDREWRVREASTGALQDLLRQCEFSKFENDLERIWLMAFRAMDDIKGSVRKEGTELTRFLANTMVLKLNSSSNISTQESILKQLVPFLLGNNGLLSDSEDVKKFAFDTIMKLISTSSKSLKPFIANMVQQLILLMSSVEPQVINYLTLNADKYNMKVEDIDSQRIGLVGSSPMMEAIEKLMDLLDEKTIGEFIDELGVAVKTSIGLPSKVAGSKAIVNLVLRHFFIISNYGDLLLKIASGQLKDRNETVAKSYAIACGYCVRISSVKKIESFGKKLTKYYFEKKSDTNSDDRLPKISSIACEAVSNFANDTLHSNASIFLPLSFIAKHDLSSEIAKNFSKVWSDSTSSSVSAIKLYFPEIISLIQLHINSQAFSLRKTIALSIIEIIETLDTRINDLNPSYLKELYELLLESLTGRVYEGKEKLLDSLVNLSCKSLKFLTNNDELYSRVESRVLNEANRKSQSYRKHSILALGNLLHIYYEDVSLYDKYLALVDEILSPKDLDSDDEDEKMDVDSSPDIRITAARSEMIQKVLLNVLYSISGGKKVNINALHYILRKVDEFLSETNIDLLPNSDSKFKFKQGILTLMTSLVNLNDEHVLTSSDKSYYEEHLFQTWLKCKDVVGSSDNLQSILVGYTRVTGLLLQKLELDPDRKASCIMALKMLKSENVNSVVTTECDKVLQKFK